MPKFTSKADAAYAEIRCCRNAVLTRMLDELWEKTDRLRRLGLELPEGDGPRDRDTAEHHRLAQLVDDGEAEAVAALMTAHVERSLTSAALVQNEDDSTPSS
ncbi:FCD domain-containing protein [Actinomyces qiguomingii]|uniref:FCD domain-containing protein n=1 Tax=Actinomyces qiguomingii TaxID=2057800 RepID=UPI000CA08CED|nr:FCD domain-containing protein [Actinomyces qiguomingii]